MFWLSQPERRRKLASRNMGSGPEMVSYRQALQNCRVALMR
jgi:hypothetical protein